MNVIEIEKEDGDSERCKWSGLQVTMISYSADITKASRPGFCRSGSCTAICPLTVSELFLSDENTIYHRHDMSEYCHPSTFMLSPSSPFLTHSEHYDEIERDDEL